MNHVFFETQKPKPQTKHKTMPKENELSWIDAIEKTLNDAGTALHYTEIAKRIDENKLRKNVGATPSASSIVHHQLSDIIKKQGRDAPFIKTGRGTFMIAKTSAPGVKGATTAQEDDEPKAQDNVKTKLKTMPKSKTTTKEKELSWTDAIEKTLNDAGTSLHYTEIAKRIIENKLRINVGATPAYSVNWYLSDIIKKQGNKAPFIKTGRGMYMAEKIAATGSQKMREAQEDDETETQYDIITSFGVFWRKDAIDWNSSTPLILGAQNIDAIPVNFFGQLGIYLLYDGREVIYVGRTTDRPLGRRLYEHTFDRLATRWNRFSWFGLLPVSPKGELQAQPSQYAAEKIIPALEAILIEALEPPQNRKRGDDLSAVEYIQKEDPEIEKKRQQDMLDSLRSKI